MAKPVPLNLEIHRKGRRVDVIDTTADPADTIALRAALQDWLTGNRWGRSLWPEFDLVARPAGGSKQLAKVRVVS